MNLAWLSTLKEVADAHSYTKAAEKLFISQPAASQHVSQLEKVFGTRLIQRLGQDLQLTEAGRQVYDMACLFEVELEATRGRVHDLIGSSKSTLTIVGAPTPLLHTLPQILKRLWDTHPQVAVNTRVKFGAEVLTAVRTGFADVGILTSVHLDGSLPVTPLGASQIICISSPNHVLACKSRISTEEASRHRIAITGIGTAVRTFVGDWFAQQGSFLENTMDVLFGRRGTDRGAGEPGDRLRGKLRRRGRYRGRPAREAGFGRLRGLDPGVPNSPQGDRGTAAIVVHRRGPARSPQVQPGRLRLRTTQRMALRLE